MKNQQISLSSLDELYNKIADIAPRNVLLELDNLSVAVASGVKY